MNFKKILEKIGKKKELTEIERLYFVKARKEHLKIVVKEPKNKKVEE